MGEFSLLQVWRDPAIARSLSWYRDVAQNRRPAKFRIGATIPVSGQLDAPEDVLWQELDRLTPIFLERWRALRAGEGQHRGARRTPEPARSLPASWPAACSRTATSAAGTAGSIAPAARKYGACKLARDTRVSTYFHHPGEELVYRGTQGSGTIFFTSCNMRCAFCQNGDISTDKDNGEVVDARTLAAMAWLLRAEGCHNVNWVGGEVTIHLHTIVEAIALLGNGFEPARADLARALPAKSDRVFWYGLEPERASFERAFNAPMLWNSNFFMTDEAMKILRLLMDVWLPDFKFGPGRCAMTLAKTPWYWETVTGNLLKLRAWGEDLTIRHLVMPNHVECCTLPGPGLDRRAHAGGAGQRHGSVPSGQLLRTR